MIYAPREAWTPDPCKARRVPPGYRQQVVIHHTASRVGVLFDSIDQVFEHARHLTTVRPKISPGDVPYQMLAALLRDGEWILLEGRGIYRIGAHIAGANTKSIGVAFMGDFEGDMPPPSQMSKVAYELTDWMSGLGALGFGNLKLVVGHRQHPGAHTACPGQYLRALPAYLGLPTPAS